MQFQNRIEANKYIKENLNFVLSKLYGISIQSGKLFRCINPEHQDKNPSMGLDETGEYPHCHCFSCGAHYDSFDLIGVYYSLNGREKDVFLKAYDIFGIDYICNNYDTEPTVKRINLTPLTNVEKTLQLLRSETVIEKENTVAHLDKYREKIKECCKNLLQTPEHLQYFVKQRGLDARIIQKYNIGLVQNYNEIAELYSKEAVISNRASVLYNYILPYDSDYFQAEISDRTKINDYYGKYIKIKGAQAPIFNASLLNGETQIIFICEGIYDALSVEAVSIYKGIALTGVALQTFKEKIQANLSVLHEHKTCFCIALDKDNTGIETTEKLIPFFKSLHLPFIVTKQYKYKDYNEFLTNDKTFFADYIEEMVRLAKEEVVKNELLLYLKDLPDIQNANTYNIDDNYDFFSECGILYLFLTDESYGRLNYCIERGLSCEWFGKKENSVIFQSIKLSSIDNVYTDKEIINSNIQKITHVSYEQIIEEYEQKAKKYYERIKEEKLFDLLDVFLSKLKQALVKRKLLQLSCNTIKRIKNYEETEKVLENLHKQLQGINEYEDLLLQNEKTLEEEINDFFLCPQNKIEGLNTGFHSLDETIGGLKEGNLVVLAGRPAMGKTALASCLAENVATYYLHSGTDILEKGSPVFFVSLEMGVKEMYIRALARTMQKSLQDLKNILSANEETYISKSTRTKFEKAKDFLLNKLPLKYWVPQKRDFYSLLEEIRKQVKQNNTKLIIIDHLQLLNLSDNDNLSNRAQELSQITKMLKRTAIELKITILLLAQLNRSLESRVDKRPTMSDLRDSGGIEENADIIIFVYRDYYYQILSKEYQELSPQERVLYQKQAELIVAKNRNGTNSVLNFSFTGEYFCFTEQKANNAWIVLKKIGEKKNVRYKEDC